MFISKTKHQYWLPLFPKDIYKHKQTSQGHKQSKLFMRNFFFTCHILQILKLFLIPLKSAGKLQMIPVPKSFNIPKFNLSRKKPKNQQQTTNYKYTVNSDNITWAIISWKLDEIINQYIYILLKWDIFKPNYFNLTSYFHILSHYVIMGKTMWF